MHPVPPRAPKVLIFLRSGGHQEDILLKLYAGGVRELSDQ